MEQAAEHRDTVAHLDPGVVRQELVLRDEMRGRVIERLPNTRCTSSCREAGMTGDGVPSARVDHERLEDEVGIGVERSPPSREVIDGSEWIEL